MVAIYTFSQPIIAFETLVQINSAGVDFTREVGRLFLSTLESHMW